MVICCDIEFDNNPDGIFLVGREISGRIILRVDKVMQVEGVIVRIEGKAVTNWEKDTSLKKSSNEIVSFHGEDVFMNFTKYLLQPQNNDTLITIEAGIQVHSFVCPIAANCPTSFEGKYGYIRYTISVILPCDQKDKLRFTRAFTINNIMDLNYNSPLLKIPINTHLTEPFGCGPCISQPFYMNVGLSQRGFVPGQTIFVEVTVNNDTNVEIERLECALLLMAEYRSQKPLLSRKSDCVIVSRLIGNAVPRRSTAKNVYELPIPATPPTSTKLCHLIHIEYLLEVTARINGVHSSRRIFSPIIIGNVPLLNVIRQQPLRSDTVNDSFPPDFLERGIDPHLYSLKTSSLPEADIYPCRYDAGAHILSVQFDDDNEQGTSPKMLGKEFTPKYPIFDM